MSEEKKTSRHVGGPLDGNTVPSEYVNVWSALLYLIDGNQVEYRRGIDGDYHYALNEQS